MIVSTDAMVTTDFTVELAMTVSPAAPETISSTAELVTTASEVVRAMTASVVVRAMTAFLAGPEMTH